MGRVALEAYVFCGCVCAGLVSGLCYDITRLLRLPFKKGKIRDGLFDALFYAMAGAVCALFLFALNGGSPRLYALFGMALGAFVYMRTFSAMFSRISKKLTFRKNKGL